MPCFACAAFSQYLLLHSFPQGSVVSGVDWALLCHICLIGSMCSSAFVLRVPIAAELTGVLRVVPSKHCVQPSYFGRFMCMFCSSVQGGFPITSIREIRILRSLTHDNIVELLEVVTDSHGKVEDGKVCAQYLTVTSKHWHVGGSDGPGPVYSSVFNRISATVPNKRRFPNWYT